LNNEQIINNYINQAKLIFKQFKNHNIVSQKDLMFDLFECSLQVCHKINNLSAKNVLNKDYNFIQSCFDNFAKNYCNYNNFLCKKIFSLEDIEKKKLLKQKLLKSFKNLENNIALNFEKVDFNEQMQF